MRLLIGIPTYRRPAMLARLLETLRAQQGLEGHDLHVFVADNDPVGREGVDTVHALAPGYPHSLIASPVLGKGISAVRNAILEQARTGGFNHLAMIDDDEWAEPHWLASLLAMANETGADVVGGPVVYRFRTLPSRDVVVSGAFPDKTKRESGPVDMIDATGNVLLNCASLARIGWPQFDDDFGLTGGGDKEYFARLKLAGLRFAWCAEALASEDVPADRTSARAVLRRAYRIGNADMRLLVKYGGPAACAKSLLLALCAQGFAAMLFPLFLTQRRMWLGRKVARSAGKISALFDRRPQVYGELPMLRASSPGIRS